MNARLQRFAERIDAMSLRERGMLLAIVLLLLWALWQTLLMAPLGERRKAHAQQIDALRTQIAALNQTVQSLAGEASADPRADAQRRLDALVAQQDQLDRHLSQATSALIAPHEMGRVLESILAQQSVRLHALRSLAPEPVDLGAATGIAPLYRHGMTIEVDGSYAELLQFVQALEALPWQFIWRELVIDRREHPRNNRLRLTLYTLSLREGWLGV